MKAPLLSKASDHQLCCHTTSLSLRMFHKPSAIPQARLRPVPFVFTDRWNYMLLKYAVYVMCHCHTFIFFLNLVIILLPSEQNYSVFCKLFKKEKKKKPILFRLRLNKSESLFLLSIMKMNRHLLHGACTSQNKISNINSTPLLVLTTHNNLQAKSSNHIKKKKVT